MIVFPGGTTVPRPGFWRRPPVAGNTPPWDRIMFGIGFVGGYFDNAYRERQREQPQQQPNVTGGQCPFRPPAFPR